MADLGALQSGVKPAPVQFHPYNFGPPPEALPADTSGLSRGQAQAALMGTVAKTLGDLPSMILGNFVAGRKVGQQMAGQDRLNDVMSGKTTLPPGTSISSDGTMTYKGPGALSPLETQEKQADILLKTQHADYYKNRGNATPGGLQRNPLFDTLGIPDDSASATPGASGAPVSGGVLSGPAGNMIPLAKPVAATSYAYHGDTYGGPNATASLIGPKGNKLDAQSLGTSPDSEAQLIKAGYKFGDMVTLHTEAGPVTRRWDDRTAQWSADGKWSIADGGKYISKVDGKAYAELPENQRLPALHGRFDFHAGTDGKPSSYAGKNILGIIPKVTTSAGAPALPTGGPADAGPGVLASTTPAAPMPRAIPMGKAVPQTDVLDSTGMPAPAPEAPTGVLATPAVAGGTPAAPEEKSEAAQIQEAIAIAQKDSDSPEKVRRINELEGQLNGVLAKDNDQANEDFGPDGMPVALPGAWPQAAFQQGAGEPPLPWEGKPVVAENNGPASVLQSPTAAATGPVGPAGPLMLPDGSVNESEAAKAADNPFGGTKLPGKGFHKGDLYMHNGMAIEVGEDGGVYGYPAKVKPGTSGVVTLKKPDPAAKYGPEAKKMMVAYGVKPNEGESEQDFLIRAAQAGREASKVPPSVQAPYFKWATSLQSNPVVKEYYTARHQAGVVDAALSTGLTPAAALGVIDAYVKAMRGGAATQGMTHILEESQPLGQRMNLLIQKITGSAKDNALLTPEMAKDVKTIIGEIQEKSKKEVEGMMEGDKDHWSTFDVPPAAVEKTYHRIFGGRPSSLDMMGLNPAAEGAAPATTGTAPAAAPAGAAGASRDNPLVVGTAEAYAAAPKGAWVRDSSGNIGRKP